MNGDMATIYQADSLPDAQMLADRLEQAEIRSYIGNEDSPLGGLTAGEQTLPVMVLADDEAAARDIVSEYEAEVSDE